MTRPKERKVIKSRLVLQIKYDENGNEVKKKIRLVAKSCAQQPGIDFHGTYAPVVKPSSIRLMIALSVKFGLKIHHMDVVTAYLKGHLDEHVYMEIPEHLAEMLEEIIKHKANPPSIIETANKWRAKIDYGDMVCLLQKALYGLKQGGKQWYERLDQKLRDMKLTPLNSDPCLFMKKEERTILLAAVYVDDILIACNNEYWLHETKHHLGTHFEIKN